MTEGQTKATLITFRFKEEIFQVQLETTFENGKVTSVSESTQKFFDYLKSLKLILETEDIYKWINSSENITLHFFSNSKNSYRVRKKAEILGLKIILWDYFIKKRAESLKKAFQTNSCLN